ncbi:MAG: SCP2 sterol-binding domain-containing protein [Shewanella sp.]|nr:SCP2 sterol-binding domain-containing protein [Shewanella sp.]MCF1430758.1 SCP2 sterol-binding domain-containing protein [Shewanella sp.]MCF1457546.1 SCP2 sterol-binding domain-containing protein [Shewanella sp.]
MANALATGAAKQLLQWAPKLATKPLAVVPFSLKAAIIRQLLGQVMVQQAQDGELDFLQGRQVAIRVTDLDLDFAVSYNGTWLITPFNNETAEVCFSASSQSLLLIASGKEDPDTLFFQRLLSIEGDTELGLEVKNLLLGIELETMPALLQYSVQTVAKTLQQLQQVAQLG